jgi:ABC-type nickel/cobalt efflux system permease component RcnA
VPSARRAPQLAVFVLCGALGAGSLAGCETTQEKAAAQRARSERILEARAKRQAQKKHEHHRQNSHKHEKGKG